MIELSFSKIQAYQRCPWLYHLVFNEDWRSGPHAKAAFGHSLHKTLAAYHESTNKEKNFPRLMELYDQNWVNEGFHSTEETLDAYERGRSILETFFNLEQERRSEVVAVEKEFALPMDGVNFRGTVDRIDRNPAGGYTVIEYKTSGQAWPAERMANDTQLTFYALGVEKGLGFKPVELAFFFLSEAQFIKTSRTPEQIQEAAGLIHEIGRKIQSEDFTPNVNWCPQCEFKTRCSKSTFIKK